MVSDSIVCVGLSDKGYGRKQARAVEKHRTHAKFEKPACIRNLICEITECILSYLRRLD
jgi:hypothetical protein